MDKRKGKLNPLEKEGFLERLGRLSDSEVQDLLEHPITFGFIPRNPKDRIYYGLIKKEAKRRGIEE